MTIFQETILQFEDNRQVPEPNLRTTYIKREESSRTRLGVYRYGSLSNYNNARVSDSVIVCCPSVEWVTTHNAVSQLTWGIWMKSVLHVPAPGDGRGLLHDIRPLTNKRQA